MLNWSEPEILPEPAHRAVSDLGCVSVNVKTEIHDDN